MSQKPETETKDTDESDGQNQKGKSPNKPYPLIDTSHSIFEFVKVRHEHSARIPVCAAAAARWELVSDWLKLWAHQESLMI